MKLNPNDFVFLKKDAKNPATEKGFWNPLPQSFAESNHSQMTTTNCDETEQETTQSFLEAGTFSDREWRPFQNGIEYFKVREEGKDILVVYQVDDDCADEPTFSKEVVRYEGSICGYWYGSDTSGNEEKCDGNSILIKINANKYVFVGCATFVFETDDEIVDFLAPNLNNDVPYAVAYGKENVYFLSDGHQFVPRAFLSNALTIESSKYVYDEFYGHVSQKKGFEKALQDMKNFKLLSDGMQIFHQEDEVSEE